MGKSIIMLCGAVMALPGSFAAAEQITFYYENIGVQPLSPVFVASHDASFDIFDEGSPASSEIESIAEMGNAGPMATLASGASGVLDYAIGGLIMPGESTSVTIMVDLAHPYVSFASMLGITNDGFMGVAYGDDALDLYRDGGLTPYDFTLSYLDAWDAGTEINTESADDLPALGGSGSPFEGGVVTQPHPGILGIADLGDDVDFWGQDIAHVTVVPEPATGLLLLAGLAGLRRRRR